MNPAPAKTSPSGQRDPGSPPTPTSAGHPRDPARHWFIERGPGRVCLTQNNQQRREEGVCFSIPYHFFFPLFVLPRPYIEGMAGALVPRALVRLRGNAGMVRGRRLAQMRKALPPFLPSVHRQEPRIPRSSLRNGSRESAPGPPTPRRCFPLFCLQPGSEVRTTTQCSSSVLVHETMALGRAGQEEDQC